MLSKYRKMDHKDIVEQSIIATYDDVFTGARKTLPKGTWQNDQHVILIVRYVLEIKLKLNMDQIPKITRQTIKGQKLWGALNRFKSIKKLLQFIYPNEFNEFDFHRVSAGYWDNIQNIKSRFEDKLKKHNIAFMDIPEIITYDILIEWGFSNPLKRHNDSPYQLINQMYPGSFKPYQFRKIPHGYAQNKEMLKEQFSSMLQLEGSDFKDVPRRVTQELLNNYRFSGAMAYYNYSPAKFILDLFPKAFTIEDFTKSQRYWQNVESVKTAVLSIIEKHNIPYEQIPKYFTKKLLVEHGYGGLLDQYNGSPIQIIQACFPGEFDILEFRRLPNRFWYEKENRIEALRSYCNKNRISVEKLSKLNRAYFKKNYPRFVSVLDRHYDSKIHLWIMETSPEYNFKPSDFNLLVGNDGQLCDSQEELLVHNALIRAFKHGTIIREGKRFTNSKYNEIYVPDWIIQFEDKKIIVEYFGLYGSNRFPGYTEKANRKIGFYRGLGNYEFVTILPSDLNGLDAFLNKKIQF